MTVNYKEFGKIFNRSLNDAAKWSIWKWLLLGGIGSFSATLQLGEKFFHWDTLKSVEFGVGAVLALYLIRFFILFGKNCFKYLHEVYVNSTYGDILIKLKDTFAKTHYYRKTSGHRDEEFMITMLAFCNDLKEIFEILTKSKCSVSIKVPLNDTKVAITTVLGNLTRDTVNRSRDTQQYLRINHTLVDNTAFIKCFNSVTKNSPVKYYLNNHVNKTQDYDNTSKDCHDGGLLPYNSELVVPIIPIINDNKLNFDCHGFICVDCVQENVFRGKYDVAILEGVADGLYDIFSTRNQFKISKNEQN